MFILSWHFVYQLKNDTLHIFIPNSLKQKYEIAYIFDRMSGYSI